MQAAAVAGFGLLLSDHEVLMDRTDELREKAIPNPFEPYGRIVYQTRPEAPNQIYVVGQWHEHPITKAVTPEVIRVQSEIFRIGERMVKKRSLELILLEGIFEGESQEVRNENVRKIRGALQKEGLLESMHTFDDTTLERLIDIRKKGIINAQGGYWLAIAYGLTIQGADDADLHRLELQTIGGKYRVSGLSGVVRTAAGKVIQEFVAIDDYLNQLRTAYTLLNTPRIIEQEYAAKRIKQRKALMVIGAEHIPDCIEFVKNDHARCIPPSSSKAPPLDQPLGYAAAGYGVTIIMPRTVERTVEHIVEQAKK